MCILAVIKHNQPLLSEKMLRKCWNLNPDGAGVMYTDQSDPSRIVVRKGFMEYKDLLDFWRGYRNEHDNTREHGFTVIHFRIGTSGGKRPEMTHPFVLYNDEMDTTQAIAHNGIIHGLGRADASDTAVFAERIRQTTKSVEWVDCLFTRMMVEEYIGSYNKLVVLTGDKVTIFNPESGELDPRTGIWWSNAGWRSRDPGVCDPRKWANRSSASTMIRHAWSLDDEPFTPPKPAGKPAEVMSEGTITIEEGEEANYYNATKHAPLKIDVGTPPHHRPGETWRYHMKWECWICTHGQRKGAIALPRQEYIHD